VQMGLTRDVPFRLAPYGNAKTAPVGPKERKNSPAGMATANLSVSRKKIRQPESAD